MSLTVTCPPPPTYSHSAHRALSLWHDSHGPSPPIKARCRASSSVRVLCVHPPSEQYAMPSQCQRLHGAPVPSSIRSSHSIAHGLSIVQAPPRRCSYGPHVPPGRCKMPSKHSLVQCCPSTVTHHHQSRRLSQAMCPAVTTITHGATHSEWRSNPSPSSTYAMLHLPRRVASPAPLCPLSRDAAAYVAIRLGGHCHWALAVSAERWLSVLSAGYQWALAVNGW